MAPARAVARAGQGPCPPGREGMKRVPPMLSSFPEAPPGADAPCGSFQAPLSHEDTLLSWCWSPGFNGHRSTCGWGSFAPQVGMTTATHGTLLGAGRPGRFGCWRKNLAPAQPVVAGPGAQPSSLGADWLWVRRKGCAKGTALCHQHILLTHRNKSTKARIFPAVARPGGSESLPSTCVGLRTAGLQGWHRHQPRCHRDKGPAEPGSCGFKDRGEAAGGRKTPNWPSR